jgi:adenylate cyclase
MTTTQDEQRDIERSLDHLVLKSERLRALAVAVLAGSLALIAWVVAMLPGTLPTGMEATYRPAIYAMVAMLATAMGYELLVMSQIKRWKQQACTTPVWFQFINVSIEVLIPSFVMWRWIQVAGFIPTVGGVLPWLYFPFIAASALHLNPKLCWFTGVSAAVAFISLCFYGVSSVPQVERSILASNTSFVLKGVLLLVCSGVAAFVAGQLSSHLVRAVELARERDRAVNIFGQHVSPQVAKRLIQQRAEHTAEQRHVCVLFLDIRGFSNIAASHTPAEVMEYLNTLFSPMITIVNQYGGIVNKFLGDGFMAIFGAPFEDPDLHRNAVKCSLELVACVEQLNSAKTIFPTRIGIGIHAGKAMAGTVGSDERREYTLLGDTVNAAARIEQETKRLESQVLVSSVVLEGLTDEQKGAMDMGEISLRGISQPLHLYRLA